MKLFQQPLVHFVLIGAALFLLNAWLSPADEFANVEVIEVTALQRQALQKSFESQYLRPPKASELQALIDQWVDEEILYREGLALGLDKGDPLLRKRIVEQVKLVHTSTIDVPVVTEDDLRAWYDANTESYVRRSKIKFEHVFFSSDKHGDETQSLALAAHQKLTGGDGDSKAMGDPFPRGSRIRTREEKLESEFGPNFKEQIMFVELERWSKPIQSTFGWHVVRVQERRQQGLLPFEKARRRVKEDLREHRTSEASRNLVAKLRARYQVLGR